MSNNILLKRVIISEYSKFYHISFGYLHPEIQSFKKREVKNAVVQFAAFIQHSIAMDESIHPARFSPLLF